MRSKRAIRAVQRQRKRKFKLLSLILLGSAFIITTAFFQIRPYMPVAGAVLEVNGAPSIRIDRELIDFGDVNYERPVGATFQLTNVGDKPLKFTKNPYIEVVEGC
jgi:hypothetical protein